MRIRRGTMHDACIVGQLYDDLCDYLSNNTNYPGWRKGIYPTIDDAVSGIRENTLYVAEMDHRIVGSVILRHESEHGYIQANWGRDVTPEKIYIIYTFAVHPDFLNKGVGSRMLEIIEDLAIKENIQAIRLDVVKDNTPAVRLYERHGFSYVDTVDLGYHEFGLDWFKLYEKNL